VGKKGNIKYKSDRNKPEKRAQGVPAREIYLFAQIKKNEQK